MISSFLSSSSKAITPAKKPSASRYVAWIDGVGAWLILTDAQVSIGRVNGNLSPLVKPTSREQEADIALIASLSRNHATIERLGEDYILKATSRVTVSNQQVTGETVLPDRCEMVLGDSVKLGFSVPTPLSATAKLTIASEHRPRTTVDGVILMAETCLLGPQASDHILCPGWSETVVLVQTSTGILLKSKQEVQIGDHKGEGPDVVSNGQVVSGDDFRFRLEPLN